MTLDETLYKDQTLSAIGIRKMLVVDDRADHIEAAKEYFKDYKLVQIHYASSAESAKEKIQIAYSSQQKYDFVLSDMQMEEKKSGQKVIEEAYKTLAPCLIITSRGAFSHGGRDFDEGTTIIGPHSYKEEISTPKSQPETWKRATETSIRYLTVEGYHLYEALKRYDKHVGQPSDLMMDCLMKVYSQSFEEKKVKRNDIQKNRSNKRRNRIRLDCRRYSLQKSE